MRIKLFIVIFCSILSSCDVSDDLYLYSKTDSLISARAYFNKVDELAESISDGLLLRNIRSDNVTIDGTSQTWIYEYCSGGIIVYYYFHASYNEVVFDSVSTNLKIGSTFITHHWFDSDYALWIAEKSGGEEFRSKHPENKIEASLGEPLVPNSTTNWYVTYCSKDDFQTKLLIIIDANTGEIKLIYP